MFGALAFAPPGKAHSVVRDDENSGKTAGVARIVIQDEERVSHMGMGVVIGLDCLHRRRATHVLTCCHVLNDAMRRRDRLDPTPPDEGVSFQVRFPYVSGESRTGRVVAWGLSSERRLDAAVLRLDEGAPKAVGVARFTKAHVEGREWQCVGADLNGKLLWPKGKIGPKVPPDRVQLDGPDGGPKPTIQPGYSGGGVWCEDKRALIGIVVSVDPDRVENGVAFAIPTRSLLRIWRLPLVLSTAALVAIAVAAAIPLAVVAHFLWPRTRVCCSNATATTVDVSKLRAPPPKVVLRNCSTTDYAEGTLKVAPGDALPLTGDRSIGGISAASPPGIYVVWGLRTTPGDQVLQSAPSRGDALFEGRDSIDSASMEVPARDSCSSPPKLTLKTPAGTVTISEAPLGAAVLRCESTVAAVQAFHAAFPLKTAVSGPTARELLLVSRAAVEVFGPFGHICFRRENEPSLRCAELRATVTYISPGGMGKRREVVTCPPGT